MAAAFDDQDFKQVKPRSRQERINKQSKETLEKEADEQARVSFQV